MSSSTPPNSTGEDSDLSRIHFCPDCRKPLRRIESNLGPFWGCSGFPRCKTKLYEHDGKLSRDADEQYRCPVCTRPMAKASNARGVYWYCIGYKKGCKVKLKDDQGKPEIAFRCRRCGQILKRRKGKKGYFWGCSRYPDCNETYNDKDGKPELDILAT